MAPSSSPSSQGISPLAGKSILFIGGGCFGVSAAYHLASRISLASTNTKVTIIDRFPSPSPNAASTDLNKIVRADYANPLYAQLGVEAMAEWTKTSGIFAGMFQQVGWFLAAENVSIPFIETSVENQRKLGITNVRKVASPAEVRAISPLYTGPMKGWQTWWNPNAGWTPSGDALAAMTSAAVDKGVQYVSGDKGWAKKLLLDSDGKCIGAETADGTRHVADVVVLSAGAASPLLLDFEGQLQAKGHVVGHIQLRPDEVERYKSMKIVDHFEQGIIFPPNKDGVIKVATVKFVTNKQGRRDGLSLPRYRTDNPRDGIPVEIEREIREWVRGFVPSLADRPWFETRICWDTDTPDFNFLIGPHPKHRNLHLATGGSAHGFKFLPVIGKYIVDSLQGQLDAEMAHTWAWRPGRPLPKKKGPDPHPYPDRDLGEFPGWESSCQSGGIVAKL